jgi:hypothetical protein
MVSLVCFNSDGAVSRHAPEQDHGRVRSEVAVWGTSGGHMGRDWTGQAIDRRDGEAYDVFRLKR